MRQGRRTVGVLVVPLVCAVALSGLTACGAGRPHAARRPAAVVAVAVTPTGSPVASPSPRSRRPRALPPIAHVSGGRTVALTFDDGPDPTWTPRILAVLARAHVHATFCLIGWEAAAHPALVRAIVRAGHALCDHTWDHDLDLAKRRPSRIRHDMTRAYDAVVQASGGIRPAFFRTPGGGWSTYIERESQRLGMRPLGWNVDPRDWTRPGVPSILATIHAELHNGGVILMHDGGGDRSQTVRALRLLLRLLPARGFRFVLPPA
ncbi:MAG TPA: polysaccharide deacetylase family protein [Mycobacteriales bacterium]|nr:polysaccharide deacetylase family protein [Mycobacteriales bacterium]